MAFEPFANPRLQKYCWIFDNWKVTLGQAWSVGFVAARSQRDQNTKLRICSSLRAELGGQVMRGDIACDQKPEGPEWGFTVEVTVEDIPILLNQMQCELTWAGANTATSTYGLLFLRVPVSSAWARVWHSYAKNLISMKSEAAFLQTHIVLRKLLWKCCNDILKVTVFSSSFNEQHICMQFIVTIYKGELHRSPCFAT